MNQPTRSGPWQDTGSTGLPSSLQPEQPCQTPQSLSRGLSSPGSKHCLAGWANVLDNAWEGKESRQPGMLVSAHYSTRHRQEKWANMRSRRGDVAPKDKDRHFPIWDFVRKCYPAKAIRLKITTTVGSPFERDPGESRFEGRIVTKATLLSHRSNSMLTAQWEG